MRNDLAAPAAQQFERARGAMFELAAIVAARQLVRARAEEPFADPAIGPVGCVSVQIALPALEQL